MSATTPKTDETGRVPLTTLQEMSEREAKETLTYAEYQRWEAINDHLEAADEQRAEWADDARITVDLIANSDPASLAVDVEVWGNDLSVYYGNDDRRIRAAAERMADAFGVDPDHAGDIDEDTLSADDIADEDVAAAKKAFADLILAAVVSWDGTPLAEVPDSALDDLRASITAAPPEGWGLAGMMDAWVEIQTAVEQSRDERMEVVRRFRPEKRGGNRAATR